MPTRELMISMARALFAWRLALTEATIDGGLIRFPAIIIGDQGQGGHGDLRLAAKAGLAGIGHAMRSKPKARCMFDSARVEKAGPFMLT